ASPVAQRLVAGHQIAPQPLLLLRVGAANHQNPIWHLCESADDGQRQPGAGHEVDLVVATGAGHGQGRAVGVEVGQQGSEARPGLVDVQQGSGVPVALDHPLLFVQPQVERRKLGAQQRTQQG
ncbi:hypothetical protein RZS08_43005, partial [Arthrospira platensis SPKY1]|nr:hypothetical protein [Arthrospira platensis SPKY1]